MGRPGAPGGQLARGGKGHRPRRARRLWWLLGALAGGGLQAAWLADHGWEGAWLRLPLGLAGGAAAVGLVRLLAALGARVWPRARGPAAYLLGLDRRSGRVAWACLLVVLALAAGLAGWWGWGRPLVGAGKVRAFFLEHAEPARPGLLALYYDGPFMVEPRESFRAQGLLDFPSAADFPGGRREHFGLRWLGVVKAPAAGVYRFGGRVDDGLAILVDGRVVARDWREAPPREVWGAVELSRGWHALDIRYRQVAGGATLSVDWQLPGGPRRSLSLAETRPLAAGAPLGEITRLRLEHGMIPWPGSTYPPFQGGRFWRVPWYGLQY
jgi:hypothetical protein